MQKRFLSMLLCMSMLFSLLPIGISAEGLEDVLQAGAVQTEDADIQVNRDDLDVPADPEDQTEQSEVVSPPDTEQIVPYFPRCSLVFRKTVQSA